MFGRKGEVTGHINRKLLIHNLWGGCSARKGTRRGMRRGTWRHPFSPRFCCTLCSHRLYVRCVAGFVFVGVLSPNPSCIFPFSSPSLSHFARCPNSNSLPLLPEYFGVVCLPTVLVSLFSFFTLINYPHDLIISQRPHLQMPLL